MLGERRGSGDRRRPANNTERRGPDSSPEGGDDGLGLLEALPHGSAESPELWQRLGQAYLKAGDCERALDALERVVAAGKATSETFAGLGRAASGLSRREEAVRYFEASLDDSPEDPALWRELGVARRRCGMAREAVSCFREAVRLESGEKVETWKELGRALRELGERGEAIEVYREALRREPGRADLWSDLAMLHTEAEDFAESDQALREAIRLKPNDAAAWRAIAQNALMRGERRTAQQAYLRMTQLSPDFAEEILTWVSSTAGLPADSVRPSSPSTNDGSFRAPAGRVIPFRSGPRG